MFNELRQHLRKLGLELALFIEDITAFTGIDEGLLDVLITQHTGEGNSAYCRLTSVIGVTDTYFSDYMPDNFKQRATHQLTLSSSSARGRSDLMQDETFRAEFAARYMNAIRIERDSLDQWVRSGASMNSMPIACDQCPFRVPCFTAFGFVEITDAGENLQIGVYPFNRRSLDTLYRGLRESYSRTPRTYLFDLLGYILQSHSGKIESGDFPPPETELTPAVQPPSFNPATHRQIVEKQGGAAANRLISLLLYWGDRSATRIGENLGALPETVFRAFNMKVIEGASGEVIGVTIPRAGENLKPAPPISSDETDRYTRLIDIWMASGKLSGYDRFAEWMADLVRSFIDWQAHGVSLDQVKEYITQGRFEIEGQTGVSQRRHRLFFERTSELRYVLQALADLNTKSEGLSPAQFGEHLTTLSAWIRSEEERIVGFVREPSGLIPPPDYLFNILVRNAVLLACLSGELKPTDDLLDLYHQVISSCAANQKWEDRIASVKDTYPAAWRTIMREVNSQDAVTLCRKALLQLLNRPQGRSEAVRYVDASHMLGILNEFCAADWAMPELTFVPETTDPTWSAALSVYRVLQKNFPVAVEACYTELRSLHTEMTAAVGEETPSQMIELMSNALERLRTVGISYSPRLDEPFDKDRNPSRWTSESFDLLLTSAASALEHETLRERAVYTGRNWVADVSLLRDRMAILRLFEQDMRKKTELLTTKIAELSRKTDAAQSYQSAIDYFEDAITLLDDIARGHND